ncbi:hypothetical protein ILYODFUR_006898 [Ilyodon furcidens]|uniref:Uncharacterized protein n=1 Tax=Ilyodon furcidens TaxID=33524 RepID=A0ABV0TT16_9TELE
MTDKAPPTLWTCVFFPLRQLGLHRSHNALQLLIPHSLSIQHHPSIMCDPDDAAEHSCDPTRCSLRVLSLVQMNVLVGEDGWGLCCCRGGSAHPQLESRLLSADLSP